MYIFLSQWKKNKKDKSCDCGTTWTACFYHYTLFILWYPLILCSQAIFCSIAEKWGNRGGWQAFRLWLYILIRYPCLEFTWPPSSSTHCLCKKWCFLHWPSGPPKALADIPHMMVLDGGLNEVNITHNMYVNVLTSYSKSSRFNEGVLRVLSHFLLLWIYKALEVPLISNCIASKKQQQHGINANFHCNKRQQSDLHQSPAQVGDV